MDRGGTPPFYRHQFVNEEDQQRLTEAYWFLRDVEHKLQMMRDLQTHALPDSNEEFTALCDSNRGIRRSRVKRRWRNFWLIGGGGRGGGASHVPVAVLPPATSDALSSGVE